MLFTSFGRIVIKNARHRSEEIAIDPSCSCYTCTHYSRAYLHHLFAAKEILASRLNTLHNLSYYLNLMADIRSALQEGTFADFYRNFYERRIDGPVKSHKSDNTVKSFRCKARESLGMRRIYGTLE